MLKIPLFWAVLGMNPSWLPVSRGSGQQSAGWSCRDGGPQVFVCTSTGFGCILPFPCEGTGQEFHGPPGHWPVTRKTQLWWKPHRLKNGKDETPGNSVGGMDWMGAWRPLWYQRYELAGLVCAQCENPDLRGWLGTSTVSFHPNGPHKPAQQQSKVVGEGERLFSLPLWLFKKTHVSEEGFLVQFF